MNFKKMKVLYPNSSSNNLPTLMVRIWDKRCKAKSTLWKVPCLCKCPSCHHLYYIFRWRGFERKDGLSEVRVDGGGIMQDGFVQQFWYYYLGRGKEEGERMVGDKGKFLRGVQQYLHTLIRSFFFSILCCVLHFTLL